MQLYTASLAQRSHVFFVHDVAIRKALDGIFDRAWAHAQPIGDLRDCAIRVIPDEIKNCDGRIKCGHNLISTHAIIYVSHKMKTIHYCFVCSDSVESVLKSLGLSPAELKTPLLELQVGDTITFENVSDLALVVTSRWMKIGQYEDRLAYMVDLTPFPV